MQIKNIVRKHPDIKFYDLENWKRFSRCFEDGEEVVISLKIHGTQCSMSVLPTTPYTVWQKFLKLIKLLPKCQYCICSRRVQVSRKKDFKGFYGQDYYTETESKYRILEKLEPGMQLFGECFGSGVQGEFTYGCKEGERKFLAFDILRDGKYMDYDDFSVFCDLKGIERVPELYRGPYSEAMVDKVRNENNHEMDKKVPCREGIVVKCVKDRNSPAIGRLALKAISDKYWLLSNSTDFH